MQSKALTYALLASLLPVAACGLGSPDEEDLGSLEQEKRVKPNGGEKHTTGTVVVKVPAGAPQLAATKIVLQPKGHSATGIATNLDTVATVPVGTWDIGVAGSNAQTVFGTIEVKGGQQTSVTLPVLAPVARTTPPKPADAAASQFTWGPVYQPRNASAVQRPPAIRVVGPGSVYANPIGTSTGIVLVPGATYEIVRRNTAGTEDVLHKLDVAIAPQVYTLPGVSDAWVPPVLDVPQSEITFDIDASDFPLAEAPVIGWQCSAQQDVAKNYVAPAVVNNKNLRAPGAASAAEKVVGKVGTPGCRYLLALASGDIALDTAKPKVTASIHFIDVEHVHLRHENGTTRDVPGKVKLSRIPGPGQPPVAISSFAYDTQRALPVSAGTYLVEVQYADNAGAKIYSEQVTVP